MRYTTLILSFLLVVLGLSAQEDPSVFDLLYQDGKVLEARLVTDVGLLVKQKMDEIYQDGVLTVYQENGDSLVFEVDIRSRGNIRKEICYFPPMRLKFSKEKYDYHKIKCVNICRDADQYEDILLKEYLAYRLLNQVTDQSFRVQLLKIQYVNPEKSRDNMHRYAFIIENKDALADRLGGKVYEPRLLKSDLMNEEYCNLFSVFQYMIGNTDWAFGNMHNIEIITDTSSNSLLPIPYDFDYSGLVDAPYATPHESMPIDNVTIRHNKSYCINKSDCDRIRNHFLERKEAILSTCDRFDILSERERKSIRKYMDRFFDICEKPKLFSRVFSKNCANSPFEERD